MMPPQSYALRGTQLAALNTVIHELITQSNTKKCLEQANALSDKLSPILQRNLALMKKQHLRYSALPSHFIEAYDKALRLSEHAWTQAKQHNNFSLFESAFLELFTLVKEKGERLSQVLGVSPFEALMDEYDPNRKQADIDTLFDKIKPFFPELIKAHLLLPQPTLAQSGTFAKAKQMKLAKALLKQFDLSLNNTRLDESLHPFSEGQKGDLRLTFSFDKENPLNALLSLLHEIGHGLYDNALPQDYLFTLVGQDAGMVAHEGLALFWEKCIGTSWHFSDYLSTLLPTYFGESSQWQADNIYDLLTQVNPNKPRIESDELCYMAHILIRYETEKALFGGDLPVKDLPDFWQAQCQQTLGITVGPTDFMQDIHWAQGYFGYFHVYGLGFLLACQLHLFIQHYQGALLHHIAQGNMIPMITFLKMHFYQHGAMFSADALIEKVTTQPLSHHACIEYLKTKYLPLT